MGAKIVCVCVCVQLSIQKDEAKKKEVHVEDNVPKPSPRSNFSVIVLNFAALNSLEWFWLLNFDGFCLFMVLMIFVVEY